MSTTAIAKMLRAMAPKAKHAQNAQWFLDAADLVERLGQGDERFCRDSGARLGAPSPPPVDARAAGTRLHPL